MLAISQVVKTQQAYQSPPLPLLLEPFDEPLVAVEEAPDVVATALPSTALHRDVNHP